MNFPNSFSLSTNEKHVSNTQESLKLIEEIIVCYVEKKRDMLNLGEDFPALLIISVFSGPVTDLVIKMLRENSNKIVSVPANTTNRF